MDVAEAVSAVDVDCSVGVDVGCFIFVASGVTVG
jgi:hypothetical protein